VVGTIISYYTIELAIWMATKDYIEHCQSDQVYSRHKSFRFNQGLTSHKEAQRATIQCQEAAGQPLPPPPFFRHDPRNSTIHRRTVFGVMIGATRTRRYNSLYVWVDALLLNAISWMVLSAVCYLAYSIALATRQKLASPLSMDTQYHRSHYTQHGDFPSPITVPAHSHHHAYLPHSSIIQSVSKGSEESTTTMRRRGNGKSGTAGLFRETLECPSISQDYESMTKWWTVQGASFRPYVISNGEPRRNYFNSEFYVERLRGNTLKAEWYRNWCTGADRNVRLLHNLYGLEVSACTGNARRISLIELIFTTTVKRYLKSILRGSSSFNQKILAVIERKDPIGFLECYTKYPDWRNDFARLIRICIGVLVDTGIDRQGDLNALYISESGNAAMVTLPKRSYSWAKILEDSVESFTLAIFAETCLSARGRACRNQRKTWRSNVILETRLWFPESGIAPTSSMASARSLSDRYWIIPSEIARKRLFHDISMRTGGYLDIIESLRHFPQNSSNPQQALLARWIQTKKTINIFKIEKWSRFSECLEEDGRPYFTTNIISPAERKHEKTE
jgi:hypothetical protein